MTIRDSIERRAQMSEEIPDDDLGMVAFGHASDRRDTCHADAASAPPVVEPAAPEDGWHSLTEEAETQATDSALSVSESHPTGSPFADADTEASGPGEASPDPAGSAEADTDYSAEAPARDQSAPEAETVADTPTNGAPVTDGVIDDAAPAAEAVEPLTNDISGPATAEATAVVVEDGVPPAEESAATSDLATLPGAGPGLVWMLQRAGVQDRAALANADAEILTRSLGLVGEVLDIAYLIELARDAPRSESLSTTGSGA